MPVGYLELHLHFSQCTSLKEKRGIIKPILAHLQHEFHLSAAEIDFQDIWKDALIGCAFVSNDSEHIYKILQSAANAVEIHWPNIELIHGNIEIIQTR